MTSVKVTTMLKQLKPNLKNVSFELSNSKKLNLDRVVEHTPPFCSVTWLDNNLTDLENHPTVSLTKQLIDRNLNVVLHLPGKIFDKGTVSKLLEILKNLGVRNILALQGEYALWKNASKEDFPYAKDLVKFIRENYHDYFCIGITGYPAGHPRTATLEVDTDYLKQKVQAGADFIITQAIFDVESLHQFYKRCKDNDINLPIIPGIFIIDTHESLMRMIKLCKLTLPNGVKAFLEGNKDNNDVIRKYGLKSAVDITTSLLNDPNIPVRCMHVFTMNNMNNVSEVIQKLNHI